MIIVCDTNIFVRETHLLRKKGGPQLVRLLQAVKGQLFVPEILKIEYVEQTRLAASEERSRASQAIGNLGTLVGSTTAPPLPSDDIVDQRTYERLESLDSLVLNLLMTDEVLAAAGRRSLQKKRPTSKTDHGYKDCLIWESVLRLPRGSTVRFISRDNKAFFDGEEFSKELIAEAVDRGIAIIGYKELDQVLRELQAAPTLDLAAVEVVDVVERQIGVEVDEADPLPAATLSTQAPVEAPETSSIPIESAAQLADHELSKIFAQAQAPFEDLDRKVFGYIAYLDGTAKPELLSLLSQSGLSAEAVRSAAERLVIGGLVRDTGNHYLPTNVAAAELAAAAAEPEIIELLTKAP